MDQAQEDAILAQAQEIKARRACEANTERRTEPPFDGKPCPMCPSSIRNLSAVVHNFLWRWKEFQRGGDGCKVRDELERIRWAVGDVQPLLTAETHEAVRTLHAAASDFLMWFDRWVDSSSNQEARAFAFERLRDEYTGKLQAASNAVGPLSDAHFADRLHSHGEIR